MVSQISMSSGLTGKINTQMDKSLDDAFWLYYMVGCCGCGCAKFGYSDCYLNRSGYWCTKSAGGITDFFGDGLYVNNGNQACLGCKKDKKGCCDGLCSSASEYKCCCCLTTSSCNSAELFTYLCQYGGDSKLCCMVSTCNQCWLFNYLGMPSEYGVPCNKCE